MTTKRVMSIQNASDEMERFYDQKELAERFSLCKRTLRRLVVKGQFPPADLTLSKTCLRWRESTIRKWVESQMGSGN